MTTRLHGFAAIEHVRKDAVAREFVGAKKSRGTIANDNHFRLSPHFTHGRPAKRRTLLGVGQRNLQVKAHPTAARID